jgi:hypothetical protein
MQIKFVTDDFAGVAAAFKAAAKEGATRALERTARRIEKDLEAATEAAGLGKRMARTWQSKTFPQGDKTSLSPAAFVWSKAPGPMRAFTEGAVIKASVGKFLAIPTQEVLRVRGRGTAGQTNQRITPAGFTRATGIELRFVAGGDGIGFLVGTTASGAFGVAGNKTKRAGFRKLTKGRIRKGAVGRNFLAFTLVPAVRLRRRIDIEEIGRRFPQYFAIELPRAIQRVAGIARSRERRRREMAAILARPYSGGFPGMTRL